MKTSALSLFLSGALLPALALLLFCSLSALAVVDLGTAARGTPYDSYMAPVRQVFDTMHDEDATLDRVNALIRQGRSFRYSHTDPRAPAPPEETAARRAGDCKDKALWLMEQLQDQDVRYVIGKLDRNSRLSHAWLLWRYEGQWWILDCTMRDHAIPADRLSANEYIPRYSFAKNAVYRH